MGGVGVPSSFEWQPGTTPLSSPFTLCACVLGYLAIVAFLKTNVRKPIELPLWVPASHNLILCLGSLVMFIGTAAESGKVQLILDYGLP